jgi:hypothetical protein
VTHDTDFEKWANKVGNLGQQVSLRDFRKDIIIELQNEAGQVALAYKVFRCWVSEYEAWSELSRYAKVLLHSVSGSTCFRRSRGCFDEGSAFVIPPTSPVGKATENFTGCSVLSANARHFGIRSRTVGDGHFSQLAREPAEHLPLD